MAYAYENLCQRILEAVGGTKNISSAFHCITRLRILVKDKSVVDFKTLNAIEDVIQVKEVGNQLQCVIGMHVPDVYKDFCAIAGISEQEAVDADEDDSALIEEAGPSKKRLLDGNPIMTLLNTIGEIMIPVLSGIIAGGMIKGVLALCTAFGWMAADSDLYTVLNAISDAPFYFLPFLVGYSAGKAFKIPPEFGIVVAGVLMYPTFLNGAADGLSFHFLLFDIPAINYSTATFPVIMSTWVFAVIYRFVNKLVPQQVRIVFVGMIALLISSPIILTVVAPLGNYLIKVAGDIFQWAFTVNPLLAGAAYCAALPVSVVTGIRGLTPVYLANYAANGFDYMFPMHLYANIAISGAVLAAAFVLKKGNAKSAAASSGMLAILGITEPGLFGTAVPLKMPLFAAVAGSAVAGIVAMQLGVVSYAFVMPGITALPTFIDDGMNFVYTLVVLAAAWASAFAVCFVLMKRFGPKEDSDKAAAETEASLE